MRARHTPLGQISGTKVFSSNFVRWNLVEFSSTTYNNEFCFIIAGIHDVTGFKQARAVSKHLQTLSLKMYNMLAD